MTTLCFDFGNTRLKCAVFINKDFREEFVLEGDTVEELERCFRKVSTTKNYSFVSNRQ